MPLCEIFIDTNCHFGILSKDIDTMNWNNFTFIDLFAGIGGIRLGFECMGGKCVFSSEFDEDACKTYEANFGEHPAGDITKIEASSIPDFDILLGGFPCQAFSIIGKKEGFANETVGIADDVVLEKNCSLIYGIAGNISFRECRKRNFAMK